MEAKFNPFWKETQENMQSAFLWGGNGKVGLGWGEVYHLHS